MYVASDEIYTNQEGGWVTVTRPLFVLSLVDDGVKRLTHECWRWWSAIQAALMVPTILGRPNRQPLPAKTGLEGILLDRKSRDGTAQCSAQIPQNSSEANHSSVHYCWEAITVHCWVMRNWQQSQSNWMYVVPVAKKWHWVRQKLPN